MQEICNIPVFNRLSKDLCCGCELCANVCPPNIITFVPDEEGFRYPHINTKDCINCGMCTKNCLALNSEIEKRIDFKVYAGYALDDNLVRNSSSGGLFTTMSEAFLNRYSDGLICGVIWNENNQYVYHTLGVLEDISLMRGSKYIQSRKGMIYKKIKEKLNENKHILFVGTGCEVTSLRKYLGKDYPNILLVDMICKGPCSEKAFNEYKSDLEKKYKSKIYSINMRYIGWKVWIPQWINIKFVSGKSLKKIFYTTDFGRAFYLMQRKSCYRCQYSGNKRLSDITIGDFHGINKKADYYNSNGVSVVVANTTTGDKFVKSLPSDVVILKEVSYEEVSKPNPCLSGPVTSNSKRNLFSELFIKHNLRYAVKKTYPIKEKIINHMSPEFAERLYKMIKRIGRH